jgi:hypothetical protein
VGDIWSQWRLVLLGWFGIGGVWFCLDGSVSVAFGFDKARGLQGDLLCRNCVGRRNRTLAQWLLSASTGVEKPLPFAFSKNRIPRLKAPEDKNHWLSTRASGCELTAERKGPFLGPYGKADASRRGSGVVEGRAKRRLSSSRRPRESGRYGPVDGRP